MHKKGWRLSLTMFVANIALQWGCLKITLNSTLCLTAFPTEQDTCYILSELIVFINLLENIPEFSITGNFGEIQRRPEVPLLKGQSRVNFSMTEPIYFLKPYIHCMTGKPIVMHRRQVRHLNCEYVNKTNRSLCLTSWLQQPSVKWWPPILITRSVLWMIYCMIYVHCSESATKDAWLYRIESVQVQAWVK